MRIVDQPSSAGSEQIDRLTVPPVLLHRLLMRCPVTGDSIETGFELVDMPDLWGHQLHVDCLDCEQDHPWELDDCFLG